MVMHTDALDKAKIQVIVKNHFQIKGDIEITKDGLVSVHGNCSLFTAITTLPVEFKEVEGIFDCSGSNLTSLTGAPQVVKSGFYCYNNDLTSLKGAPLSVGGMFDCHSNSLISLEGAPLSVADMFDCSNNKLISLKGAPQSVGSSFYCYRNKLTSLEGAPQYIDGNFNASDNNLKTLEGLPSSFTNIVVVWTESLPLLRLVGRKVSLRPVKESIAKAIHVSAIINKYQNQPTRANILACQKQLIDAGFEGNASW